MRLRQLHIAQTRSITVTDFESSNKIGIWDDQDGPAAYAALPTRQEDYEEPVTNDNTRKNSNFPEFFDLYLSPEYEKIIAARTKIRRDFKSMQNQIKLDKKTRYEKIVKKYSQ